MAVWRVRIACWIPKATHKRARARTHAHTLIKFNTYCFHGKNGYANAPVLRYTYTACILKDTPVKINALL